MRYVCLIAALMSVSAVKAAGQCYGCALEVTQRLNLGKLTSTVVTMGEIIANLQQNSQQAGRVPTDAFMRDLSWLEKALQYGMAVSASASDVDRQFRAAFPGYGRLAGPYTQSYQKWSAVTLDTATSVMRAIQAQKARAKQETDRANGDVDQSDSQDSQMAVAQLTNRLSSQTIYQLQELRALMQAQYAAESTYTAAREQDRATGQEAADHFFTHIEQTDRGNPGVRLQ